MPETQLKEICEESYNRLKKSVHGIREVFKLNYFG